MLERQAVFPAQLAGNVLKLMAARMHPVLLANTHWEARLNVPTALQV